MDQPNQNLFELQIDQQSFSYFSEAAKWAKFIAILGFIFCALMVVIGLFAGTMMASLFSSFGGGASGVGSMIGGGFFVFFYIAFSLIYFFPCLFLYRFASQMQDAIRNNEQMKLQNSIKNLKSFFRFIGILFIIILAIYVLMILIVMVVGIGNM